MTNKTDMTAEAKTNLTPEDIINAIQAEHSMGPYEYLEYSDCIRAMEQYANQKALSIIEQAVGEVKPDLSKEERWGANEVFRAVKHKLQGGGDEYRKGYDGGTPKNV